MEGRTDSVKTSTGNAGASGAFPPATPPSADTQSGGVYTSKHTTGSEHASTLVTVSAEKLERTTVTLSIRLPIKYKFIYDELAHREKYYFKLGVMALLEALGKGGARGVAGPVIVNLNVQSQEVHQVHPADTIYEERIRMLERKLRHAEHLLKQYRELLRKLKVAASQGDAKTVLATLRTLEV